MSRTYDNEKKPSQFTNSVQPTASYLQTRGFAPLQTDLDEDAPVRPSGYSENFLEKIINQRGTQSSSPDTPVQAKPMNRLKVARMAMIQAKLSIGEPNDKYEQEADATASKVVQQINSPTQDKSVQREAMEEEDELQMKTLVQRRENLGGGEASTDLESSIQSARGSGQSLDPNLQAKMGQAMGADFSGVKVHTDSQSDQLNKSIQAKAFTTGQDVFFRQGAYDPSSRGGQELIAHELTHVVQQNDNHKSKSSPQYTSISSASQPELQCVFSNPSSLTSHYAKHVTTQNDAGDAYASESEYEAAADKIVADSSSKSKPRGGGGMYYLNETTGQFVATNSSGGVLTMFVPSSDPEAYFNKQT
jgi:hypothetical protein